jgi:hypothetical protein
MSPRFWGRFIKNLRIAGESITWVTVVVGYSVLMGLTMSERAAVAKTKARAYSGADRVNAGSRPLRRVRNRPFGDIRSQRRPSVSIAEPRAVSESLRHQEGLLSRRGVACGTP